jgi:hypothetical protein
MSQMGAVGVAQSVEALQPPHAPLAVQTVLPRQSLEPKRHLMQVSVEASQTGVFPPQPALLLGSQTAQRPAMHSCLPSVRLSQPVLSAHSTHELAPALLTMQ